MTGYIPPHSIEAEQAVLGAVFCDPSVFDDVRLRPEDFWRASHQHIWRAMQHVRVSGADVDWVNVGDQVKRDGALEECGGKDALHKYLSDASHAVPSAYGYERYEAIVKDNAIRREAILRAMDIRGLALDETRTADDVVAQFALDATALLDDAVTTPDLDAPAIIAELEDLYDNPPERITTTYEPLDQTGQFAKGSLNTISGRPGHGKSSLSANFTARLHKAGIKVGVVTLEMQRYQYAQLVLSVHAGVGRRRHEQGRLYPDELQRLKQSREELRSGWKITDRSMTVEQIASLARRWARKDGIKVVMVDHLQRVKPSDSRADPVRNIAHITWSLAELARSTGLVVIMGAQLNREAEKDSGSAQNRHLKGGGSIEEDSAMVIQLKVDEAACKPDDDEWTLELVKTKDRYGSLARCPIRFEKKTGRMVEITPGDAIAAQFDSGTDGRYEQAYPTEAQNG